MDLSEIYALLQEWIIKPQFNSCRVRVGMLNDDPRLANSFIINQSIPRVGYRYKLKQSNSIGVWLLPNYPMWSSVTNIKHI